MQTSIFHIPGTDETRTVPEGQHWLCLSLGWTFIGPGPDKPVTVIPPDRIPAKRQKKEHKDELVNG